MQLFFFIVYIFEAIIALIYFSDNYVLKKSHGYSIFLAIALYILGFLVNILDGNNFIINDFVFFLINIIISKSCFEISLKGSIFHSSLLLAIMFVTELLAEAEASYLLNIPLDAYKNSLTALIILGIISKVLYLLICKIISFLFSYKGKINVDSKKSSALFLYPIMVTAMLTTFLYASTKYDFSKNLNMVCAVISILSLLFCCFIFVYNQIVENQRDELISLQAQNQRVELNKTFYNLLEQKNEEQRILVHDMKHHLYAINSMNDINAIKKYVAKIQPEIEEYQYIGKTGNKMFDLILNRYSMICSSQGINFEADIKTSNLSFIDDNDLVSLLGNLFDNAIEASKACNEPYIRIFTKTERNFAILIIENSTANAPVSQNDKLVSTKSGTSFHGYGTKSIEKTVEKYNGVCQWDYDSKLNEFRFNIFFNI